MATVEPITTNAAIRRIANSPQNSQPEHRHYDTIEHVFKTSIAQARDFLFDKRLFELEMLRLEADFDVPLELLTSFLRHLHLVHVKRNAMRIRSSQAMLVQWYSDGQSIRQISKRCNYPPSLTARFIVEVVAGLQNKKRTLTQAMKNPEQHLGDVDAIVTKYQVTEEIHLSHAVDGKTTTVATTVTTTRLAREVKEAIEYDPMYGPIQDRAKHLVGIEYEVLLEFQLRKMGIRFETEAQLRERGTSRTPDVLLHCPLGVEVPSAHGEIEWKVVNWIDSKAFFGDTTTHTTDVLPQAESYVNRFGPGMVLYWFGHAPLDRLHDGKGEIVVIGWKLPKRLMLPTGQYVEMQQDI